AVKAHFGRIGTIGAGVELSYLLKAHDLGPKRVRLFNITDIQHQMVNPHRGPRSMGWGRDVVTLCHWPLLPALVGPFDIAEDTRRARRSQAGVFRQSVRQG